MNNLLSLILDTLIPASPDGRMPGAGSLELADAVRAETAGATDVVAAGLAAAEERNFANHDDAGRTAVLREIESTQPAFIPTLFVPTCIAYYQHPEVLIGLGLEPRPPHPKGYDLDPGNLEALERVRRRGKRYRDAP
jgi:hypothetical protein